MTWSQENQRRFKHRKDFDMAQWFYGNFTWYCSCLGGSCDTGTGGACGNCRDNYIHVAWTKLSTTGCNFPCNSALPWKACGDIIVIWGRCQNLTSYSGIKDCAPLSAQASCSIRPRCNGVIYDGDRTPLADLTRSAFLAIHNNLTDGRIRGAVYA